MPSAKDACSFCGGPKNKVASRCQNCRLRQEHTHPSRCCYDKHGCRCQGCKDKRAEGARLYRRGQSLKYWSYEAQAKRDEQEGGWGQRTRAALTAGPEMTYTRTELLRLRGYPEDVCA